MSTKRTPFTEAQDKPVRQQFEAELRKLRMQLWEFERRLAAHPVAITPRRRQQLQIARSELMRAQVLIAGAESFILSEPEVGKRKGNRV